MFRIAPFCLTLAVALSALLAPAASAETGAQLGLPGISVPNDPHVNGFRFSFLYGDNQLMEGLDMGLLSLSETETLSGVQLILGLGKVNGDMKGGAAFSLVNIHNGNDSGLNAAFINKVNNAEEAVGIGFVNIASGQTMLDIGGLNMSKSSTAQLGFINVTDEIRGFQLGFINVAKNGFLPVFPFFNFAMPEGSE